MPTPVFRRTIPLLFALVSAPLGLVAAQQHPLAVYLSADMEGIAGLSSMQDPMGPKLMTREVNAAVAGAFAAGATRVVVNDAHGSHANLLVDQLDPRAILFRGALKPYGMMEGLDSSFSAVLFVGFHGKGKSLGGFEAHTGTNEIADLRINGVSVGEYGMNTIFAAWYGVPVAFVSGDSLALVQMRTLVPGVAGVAVKTGIWNEAVRTLSPDSAQAAIAREVERALRGRLPATLRVARPVIVELDYTTSVLADIAEGIPGVRRTGYGTVSFTTPGYPEAYRMIRVLYRHLRP